MALDRKEVERMLKAGQPDPRAAAAGTVDATPEFEEYTAPPRLDEHGRPIGKSKGLKEAGYQFPPKDPNAPTPPMTKANLAKGIGVPEIPRPAPGGSAAPASWPVPSLPGQPARSVPPAHARTDKPLPPPSETVEDTGLFEVFQRPGLDQNPRTGRGLRSEPSTPRAADILARMPEPQAEVVTPKRFAVYDPPSRPKPTEQEEDAAELDAQADVAATAVAAPDVVMSEPVENGPIKTVIHHDEGHREEVILPPPTPSPLPPRPSQPVQASQPHFSDAPRPAPQPKGPDSCRVGVVQATFNLAITDAMLAKARREIDRLGLSLAAHVRVPGAYDTPLAAQHLLKRDDVDAVIVIGCIIQGETRHDELIAHATAKTLQELALRFEKPVGLAITGPGMTEVGAWTRLDNAAFAVASVAEQHALLA